jgi:hypothetical protein
VRASESVGSGTDSVRGVGTRCQDQWGDAGRNWGRMGVYRQHLWSVVQVFNANPPSYPALLPASMPEMTS